MSRNAGILSAGSRSSRHHNSLPEDLAATGILRTKSKKRKAKREDGDGDGFIDSRSSRKILKIGQELVDEEQQASQRAVTGTAFAFESRIEEKNEPKEDLLEDDGEVWADEDGEGIEEAVCDYVRSAFQLSVANWECTTGSRS